MVLAVCIVSAIVILTMFAVHLLSGAIWAVVVTSVIMLVFIAGCAWAVTRNITKKIMMPIYKIDINNIDEALIYPELLPFYERIKAERVEKEKIDAMRREFSANVSHELKTPLTSISGYAQMINNGMAKQEDISMFGLKIEKEAERLLLLIDDIIRLSKLDEATGIDVPEKVKLNEVAAEMISRLESQIEKREVSVYYSGDECFIDGKVTLIGEMVYNILDNAIKYNKQGGRIDVYVGNSAKGIEFSVADTGIGIHEEDLDRIFERFYRADKSHSKTIGGTGLGMSIVKHVAIAHDADIDIKSEIGIGTTVTVTFKPGKL